MPASEGLTYEPEDEYIADPYFLSVLNEEREIIVGDNFYKYVDNAVLSCHVDEIDEFRDHYAMWWLADPNQHPDFPSEINRYVINDITDFHSGDAGNNETESDIVHLPIANEPLQLANGVTIPSSDVYSIEYRGWGGDASGFSKWVSSWFGLNVTANNNFDDRNRMKVRMYIQDYVVYRSVGMTVRMQRRLLGIWWRKKAQEFRYGWTAIEIEHTVDVNLFSKPNPHNPSLPGIKEFPPFIEKPFPYQNKEITLFHVPIVDYNVTGNDVNIAYSAGVGAVTNMIQDYMRSYSNKQNNAHGLYTQPKSTSLLFLYPKGEEVSYNEGREVVRWEETPFSGTFIAGVNYNLSTREFGSPKIMNISTSKSEIRRGEIYASVKYNDKWKAIKISTSNKNSFNH